MSNKNIEMLKTFFSVLMNNIETKKSLIPDSYVGDVYSIKYKELLKGGYNNIIFDIDNTLLPVNDRNVPEKLIKLFNKLKKDNFNICIVSNNCLERVVLPAKNLGVKSLAKANKPKKEAFDRALNLLGSKKKNTVMVGDQMLTDIKGANDYGLYTILVDPVDNKYDIKTGTSRVLQNKIEKVLSKDKLFSYGKYY